MNLMTDFAFKRLFGSKERKKILIRFLNCLFEKENITIEDVDFHDKELLPFNNDGKRIVYDVYCTTHDEDQHIIVEMQKSYHPLFDNRALHYWAMAYVSQLHRGSDYNFKPVYTIFLVDFHFPDMSKKYMHDVCLMDRESHEIFSDKLRMFFLHLNEAPKTWVACKNDYDKILFLVKNMHKMDKNSDAYKSGEFDDMFRESEIGNMVAEDIVAYSESYMRYNDNLAAVEYAANKNREEGREEGRAEGRAEGREEGRAEGREEERIAMAKAFYALGIDITTIAKASSLSVEEIKRITMDRP